MRREGQRGPYREREEKEKKMCHALRGKKRAAHHVVRLVCIACLVFGGLIVAMLPLIASEKMPQIELPPTTMRDGAAGIPKALETARKTMNDDQFRTLLRTIPLRATASIGLYAYDADSWWTNDMNLQHAGAIKRDLVLPLVTHRTVNPEFWDELLVKFRSNDTISGIPRAIGKILLLQEISEQRRGIDPVELEESAAYVARNLIWKGINGLPSGAETAQEVQEILAQRAFLAEERLFKGNVLVVSHGELMWNSVGATKKDTPRFGTKSYIDGILRRHELESKDASSVTHFTPSVQDASGYSVTKISITETKRRVLYFLRNNVEPVTFIFDGHGFNDALYLFDGDIDDDKKVRPSESTHKISVDDIVAALEERWNRQHEAYPDDTELNVSMIIFSCSSQDYIRNVVTGLQKKDVPLPHFMITSSEYGQSSLSHWENPYGSIFNELVVMSGTVRDLLIERKHMVPDSNPSVFMPRRVKPGELKKTLMQVGNLSLHVKAIATT